MQKLVGLVALCAGCTSSVIELQLGFSDSALQWDTSCVNTIELRAIGEHYPVDPTDFTSTVLQLPSAASNYAAVRDMIHDKVALDLPKTGLAGISLMGWSAPADFHTLADNWYPTPELAFFAQQSYTGQDEVVLPLVPNMNCPKTPMKVRVVDMFALVAGGSSASCATAMAYTDNVGWSGTGTIVPNLFGSGVEFYGAQSFAIGAQSLAQFSGATQVGPQSCLALVGADDTGSSAGCAVQGPTVCAG